MNPPEIGPNDFRCAACGGVFEKGWSDEEAVAERDALFPNAVAAGMPFSVVCDDCFKRMTAWRNPVEFDATENPA